MEAQAGDIARTWLERLQAEGNPLATLTPSAQLWSSASFWVAIVIEGLRHGDLSGVRENARLGTGRLVASGIKASNLVAAGITLKQLICERLAAHGPDFHVEATAGCAALDRFYDRLVVDLVRGFEQVSAPRPGAASEAAQALAAQRQAMVNRLARAIAMETEPALITQRVLNSAVVLAGATRGAVALWDEGAGTLAYAHAHNLSLEELQTWQREHGELLAAQVCLRRKAILLDNMPAHPEPEVGAFAEHFGVRRALLMPLVAADRCLGAVLLFDPVAGEVWDAGHLSMVADLLARGSLAIQNLGLIGAARERARELAQLNEATRRFAELGDIGALLQDALESAVSLVRARYGLLWRAVNSNWDLVAVKGRPRPRQARLPAALAEELLLHPQPLVAPPELLQQPPLASLGAATAVFVPVHSGGGEHRALMGLFDKQGAGGFSLRDTDMLAALEHQLSLSLRNSELLLSSQQLAARLRNAIDRLGSALAVALDAEEMLGLVNELLLELTRGQGVIAYLQDEEEGLRAVTGLLAGEKGAFTPPPELLARTVTRAVEQRQVVELSVKQAELPAADRQWLQERGVRSLLALPMVLKKEVTGVFLVLRESAPPLAESDRQLLTTFVAQAAVGVENVQLFQAMQRRLVELADFTWVSTKMTGTLERPVILDTIVRGVQKAINVPLVFVALLHNQHEIYVPPEGQYGLPATALPRLRVALTDSLLMRHVITSRAAVALPELTASPYRDDPLVRELADMRSLVAVPLGSGRDGVLGALCVADVNRRLFKSHEEALLSVYANHAALALQNASNYQAVVRHVQELETVLDVTKSLITSLELDQILQHLLQATTELLAAPVASLMLLDEATGELVTRAQIGLEQGHPLFYRMKVGEGLAGIVAETGQPLASRQVSRDGRFKAREAARAERLQSMLSVPMVSRGKVRGVLNVFTRRQHEFTEAEMRLLTTVASEASVAIENAELYEAAKEQARSMQALMEEVNHRIKNNLQSILGIVQLQMSSAPEPCPCHPGEGVKDALRDIIARIQAIAVVHELLLDEDVREVDTRETARRILENARQAMVKPGMHISGQVSGARVRLPSRKATALASIINELVYNSLKHAFPGRTEGTVSISMQETGGREVLVQVKDDGVGLPPGFTLDDAHLGLRIVQGMVRQDLQGEFSLSSNEGTVARVIFSK